MAKATWNGQLLAESDNTIVVEGNHYFPPDSVRSEFFVENSKTSVCPWKGTANYFDVVVDGAENPAAAWVYRAPSAAAADIKDHVAFWHGVEVS